MSKKLLLLVCGFYLSMFAFSQIAPIGNCGTTLTAYTNTSANDSIYMFEVSANPALIASSNQGTGPFDYYWQTFDPVNNAWTSYTETLNQATSTISNLPPAAYRVSIFDVNDNFVISYQAWVAEVEYIPGDLSQMYLNMESDCNSVHLWMDFILGSGGSTITPHYDLPPAPFPVAASTEISICFSGNHSWVSDLGFFLIGPPSCGSPVISLAPNPGSIGMGTVCNSGNNISNLCFSTESTANFNVCTSGTPLTGTYGTYGATPTNILWTDLYGCDVNGGGWSVQIFDCIGLDTGNLTDATLVFNGPNSEGVYTTVTYSTPFGFSSAINDNSCSQSSASIFQVSTTQAEPIEYTWHWEINSDPYVYIADSLDNFDLTLSAPNDTTLFWYDLVLLDADSNYVYAFETNDYSGLHDCFGGGGIGPQPVQFVPVDPITPEIFGPSQVCENEFVQLLASEPSGMWAGPGIDPSGNIPGASFTAVYTYTINQECYLPADFVLVVMPQIQQVFSENLGEYCNNQGAININALGPNPTFTGPNIAQIGDQASFSPGSLTAGYYTISESGGDPNICMTYTATHDILILEAPQVIINPIADICETTLPVPLTSNLPLGMWTGPGVIGNLFDPSIGAGTYTIIFLDPTSCDANGQLVINVFPEPEVIISDPGLICADGASVTLTSSAPGGSWSGSGIVDATTGMFNPVISGAGNISVNYSTGGICPTSTDYLIIVTPVPTPNAGPDVTICEGDQTTLQVNSGWDSVEWSTSEFTESIVVDQPNVYSVTVSANGCFASDNVQVFMTTMPVIDLGDDIQQVCEGSMITIFSGYNGEWSNGDLGSSASTGNEGVLSFIYPNSGCPVGDTIYIEVVEYPNIALGPDLDICPGDNATISTNGLIGTWNLGLSGTEVTVSNPATYVFTSSNWECTATDTVVVTWKDLPVLILPETMVGCIDELVLINVQNDANTSYLWSTGETEPSITVAEPDVYSVIVGNDCGEIEGATEVTFEDCSPQLFVPNAFSPNDDGINDFWTPKMYGIVEYKVQVFNRWGFVVFETNDPSKVWSGTVNNSEYYTPDGVYSYRVEYLDIRNNRDILVGTVTLIR